MDPKTSSVALATAGEDGVFEIPNWRYDNTLSAELPAVIPGKENPNGQGERCPGARASQ